MSCQENNIHHTVLCIYINIYHGPHKPTFLEVFIVDKLIFRRPKPLFFMVSGGSWDIYIYHLYQVWRSEISKVSKAPFWWFGFRHLTSRTFVFVVSSMKKFTILVSTQK